MQRRQLNSPVGITSSGHYRKPMFAVHERTDDNPPFVCPIGIVAYSYGLETGSWIAWDDEIEERNRGRIAANYIHLYPRPQGDYKAALAAALGQTP